MIDPKLVTREYYALVEMSLLKLINTIFSISVKRSLKKDKIVN